MKDLDDCERRGEESEEWSEARYIRGSWAILVFHAMTSFVTAQATRKETGSRVF